MDLVQARHEKWSNEKQDIQMLKSTSIFLLIMIIGNEDEHSLNDIIECLDLDYICYLLAKMYGQRIVKKKKQIIL